MKHIFLLNKEDVLLAKAEVEAVFGVKGKVVSDFFVGDVEVNKISKLANRLAYTKKVLQLLFVCKSDRLDQKIDSFDWNSVYSKDFCVRKYGSDWDERKLAGMIWNRLKNPKANLKNAKTKIEFYFRTGKVYCGLVRCDMKEGFEQRRPHLKPVLHPTSIKPRLARLCVNLTGAEDGSLVVDPFCGVGGLLVEAGLVGCKVRGYDINPWMLRAAEKNLKHYGIKKYKLVKKDAVKIGKVKYLLTDLPYGKNSRISDELDKLYNGFLKQLSLVLSGRAVVIFPMFKGRVFNYKKYLKNTKLKVCGEFEYYLHKSLSKKIVVISKA